MSIRPARPDEAAALSDLALRSKAVWGYDADFLERCRAELTLHPEQIVPWRAHVADEAGVIVGFFTVKGSPPEGELDSLYVAPSALRRGVGRALLEAARTLARREGFRALSIHADPHAESFYLRQGATRAGDAPSCSIPGRMLPLLRLAITE
ncbi:MAG TPA: GNAT family N-acetyltransferase [Polyangiaceae bacterium]|jgi:GNAT superfamily N-acetyltransferase